MRKRQMPLLREEEVEVEVGAETLVERDAAPVELGTLGGAVVRADDRRVAPGCTGADVALLEDRDVGDAVVLRQVVRGREAVRAAADDHDVVAALHLAPRPPHALNSEDVPHSMPSSTSSTTSPTYCPNSCGKKMRKRGPSRSTNAGTSATFPTAGNASRSRAVRRRMARSASSSRPARAPVTSITVPGS